MSVGYRLIAPDDLDAASIDAWRAIQSKTNEFASPYFCPEFTQLVGKVRDDVRVVVIENDGRIVGFFPHQRSFLGMGKPVGGPLSDYHGVIAEPDSLWELDALLRAANICVWTFDHLVGDVRKFQSHVTARATSPQIDLSPGYQQYAQERSIVKSNYVKETEGLARKERKLVREFGELRFTLHDAGREPMERLLAWKREQYLKSKTTDAFGVLWTRNLLQMIANTQTPMFAGVFSVMRIGDRIVAAHMGMRSRDVLHYWFPAYDQEFAKFSTGLILLQRMAAALVGIGVRIIDLGKGDSRYKQHLMTGAVELKEGSVELPSLLASARRLQRVAEAHATRGGMGSSLRLPLKAIRRVERILKFR